MNYDEILERMEGLMFDRDTITTGIDDEINSRKLELERLELERKNMVFEQQGMIDDLEIKLKSMLIDNKESIKGRRVNYTYSERTTVDVKAFDALIEANPGLGIMNTSKRTTPVITRRGVK